MVQKYQGITASLFPVEVSPSEFKDENPSGSK